MIEPSFAVALKPNGNHNLRILFIIIWLYNRVAEGRVAPFRNV